MKKTPGDNIILHKCTKNHDLMLYCSWDMVCGRCNCYFSFWAIFCPFTSLTAQKLKIFKKWKNCLEISSFYIHVPKTMIRWCTVPEIWCMSDGQTDGRKKWHIDVGAPPNNSLNQNAAWCLNELCETTGQMLNHQSNINLILQNAKY